MCFSHLGLSSFLSLLQPRLETSMCTLGYSTGAWVGDLLTYKLSLLPAWNSPCKAAEPHGALVSFNEGVIDELLLRENRLEALCNNPGGWMNSTRALSLVFKREVWRPLVRGRGCTHSDYHGLSYVPYFRMMRSLTLVGGYREARTLAMVSLDEIMGWDPHGRISAPPCRHTREPALLSSPQEPSGKAVSSLPHEWPCWHLGTLWSQLPELRE